MPREIEELTPRQLQRMTEAHNRREQAEARREQLLAYNTAALTVSFFSSGLNGKRLPEFEACFPEDAGGREMTDEDLIRQIVTINRLIGGNVQYADGEDE